MAGFLAHLEQIPIGKRGVERIDAHGHCFAGPVESEQGLDDLCAGRFLGIQRHAVLEVEHDHIGLAVLGLDVHFLQMPGNGKVGSSWFHGGSLVKRGGG